MPDITFDEKAAIWDKNPMNIERSIAISSCLRKLVPLNKTMKALEYGAGTGLLSFNLRDEFQEILLMDISPEMIKICREKSEAYQTTHIKTVVFDLEKDQYPEKFDMIFNQMVFHHINDINLIIEKFHEMLHPGGYLVIADLYAEDGSFHGPEIKVHPGFDPESLSCTLSKAGFSNTFYQPCFVMRKENREYPIFIMTARKSDPETQPAWH